MKKIIILTGLLILINTSFAFAGPKISIFPQSPKIGNVFTVYLETTSTFEATAFSFAGKKIDFYKHDDKYKAIIPVGLDTKPGQQQLNITIKGKNGKTIELKKFIIVKNTYFPKRWFNLKRKKARLLTKEIINNEWDKIQKALDKKRSEQLWKGKFELPAKGIITMPFGSIQFIDGKKSGQHRGLDIANKAGTKVKSANSGQVVLTEDFLAFGNTIVIDHGQGVFSLYFHLINFAVKPNEIVWKGKVIGNMGSTGLSSGPHVHFAISVQNIRVNPYQWTQLDLSE